MSCCSTRVVTVSGGAADFSNLSAAQQADLCAAVADCTTLIVSRVNALADIPNPTTLEAGAAYFVTNDGLNNGLWLVDGPLGGLGTGIGQI